MDLSVIVVLFAVITCFGAYLNHKVIAEKNQKLFNYDIIEVSQIDSIQKYLQRLETSYKIPQNVSFEDYYKEYKNNVTQAVEIQSPNYPNPYPVNKITEYIISVENSTGIQLIIHILDVNPQKDYLKFIPMNFDNSVQQKPLLILTGKHMNPIKFRILNTTKMKVEFGANSDLNHSYKGFIFTYSPYGNISEPPRIKPPDVQLPFDELDDIRTLIVVPQDQQINNTWQNFRNLLCQSTNTWIYDEKLKLENCKMDNVTFKSISKCPKFWPNYETCIQLTFSISLYSTEIPLTTVNPLIEESKPRYPAALSQIQLYNVWNKYAKEKFEAIGIIEYHEPNTISTIILWICIGFALIIIILLIILAAFRLNIFKNYINWSSKTDDDKENILDKNQEFDITMIPAPEQIIPDVVERYADGLYERNVVDMQRSTMLQEKTNNEKNETDYKRNSASLKGVTNPIFVEDNKAIA